jgi:predicted HTH transcriptional regulator
MNKSLKIETDCQHIFDLISLGENQMLDFKFAINDSKKIAKSMSAFANTDGGTLLIGVKDNGKIAGVSTEEEYYMIEAAAQMYSKPEIPFIAKRWEINDKTVLEIIIEKSEKKPHFAMDIDKKWLAYIRVKDQNLLVNNVLLKVWKSEKNQKPIRIKYSRKEELLLSYLAENKTITFSKFYTLAQIPKYIAENILADFIKMDLIEIIITEKNTYYQLKTK